MIRIKEKDINENYSPLTIGGMSYYELSKSKCLPTHFTRTMGENGFDKIKYYRLDLDTQ